MSNVETIIGAPNLRLINAVTQFVGGTQAVWNDITLPIPEGLVVYAVDTTALKLGDGSTLYADLPVLFNLNTLTTKLSGFRTQLSSDTTLYVVQSGSDITGNGSNTAPFASLSAAWNYAVNNLDLKGYTLSISVGNGSFAPLCVTGKLVGQTTPVSIVGAGVTTVIGGSLMGAALAAIHADDGASISLSNMVLSNPATLGDTNNGWGVVLSTRKSNIGLGTGLNIGVCNLSQFCSLSDGFIYALTESTVINVIDVAGYLISASEKSEMKFLDTQFVFTANVSYSQSIVRVSNNSYVKLTGINTWTVPAGSFTTGGPKFSLDTNGILDTGGSYTSLPGTVSGTQISGGISI